MKKNRWTIPAAPKYIQRSVLGARVYVVRFWVQVHAHQLVDFVCFSNSLTSTPWSNTLPSGLIFPLVQAGNCSSHPESAPSKAFEWTLFFNLRWPLESVAGANCCNRKERHVKENMSSEAKKTQIPSSQCRLFQSSHFVRSRDHTGQLANKIFTPKAVCKAAIVPLAHI